MNDSFTPIGQRAARVATRPPLWVLVITIAAVLMISGLAAPAIAERDGERDDDRDDDRDERPTIILVHGAWAGPSSWDLVVKRLHRDGYVTSTPTLDLLSVAGDVATVRAALDSIPGRKILVAHSYGGFVISNAAFGRSDVLGLVFSAGFVPDQGDSIASLSVGFKPSEAFNHLIFTGTPFDSPAFIDPAFFPRFFCQDLSPKRAAALNAAQRPIHARILFTPSGPVAWHTLPSWYAVSGEDLIIDPEQERFMAQRAGATTIEFSEASHAGGIATNRYAKQFVKLIERAVEQTTDDDDDDDEEDD